MNHGRTKRRVLFAAVLIATVLGLARSLSWLPEHGDGLVSVVAVIDGDTIVVEGGEQVRYIGIDTPEVAGGTVQCFGDAATERNRELVGGKRVRLEPDITDRDAYGRLLRYVYVPAAYPGQADTFVNFALVASGYARTLYIKPDVTHYPSLRAAEEAARRAQLGLWRACR